MSTLAEHLAQLLADQSFQDVVLVALPEGGGPAKEIPANSKLLARSPVFARMFQSEFAEGALRRATVPVTTPRALEQLVHYLYTDSMDFGNPGGEPWSMDDTVDLVGLLDRYEMPPGAAEMAWGKLMSQLDGSVNCALTAAQRALVVGLPQESTFAIATQMVELAKFGEGELARVLAWTLNVDRRYGLLCEERARGLRMRCMDKVTLDLDKLRLELEKSGADTSPETCAGRSMVLSRFLQLSSATLQTSVSSSRSEKCRGTFECRRLLDGGMKCGATQPCKCVLSVEFTEAINTDSRPCIMFGAERLADEMGALLRGHMAQLKEADTDIKECIRERQRAEEAEHREQELRQRVFELEARLRQYEDDNTDAVCEHELVLRNVDKA